MTFTIYDRSQQLGAPVELYHFWFGDEPAQNFYYTGAEFEITHQGDVYAPIAIERNPIIVDGKVDKTQIAVSIPILSDLSNLFLPYPPPGVVKFQMWQGHLTDTDQQFMVVWNGRVMSVAREKEKAVLTADNTLLSFQRIGLRRKYMHGCAYTLYDPDTCKADKEAAGRDVVIEDIAPDYGYIILPSGWNLPYAPQHFIRGQMVWDGELGRESRTVIGATETELRVQGYVRFLEAGDTIRMYLGCAHNTDHCTGLHDNINNYGGQPQIPFKNPTKQHPFW